VDIIDIIAVDNLSGRQFEVFLEKLLVNLGFTHVRRTPFSGDFGGDIVAEKDGKRWVIQAKRRARTVGVRAVQEAHAAREYYGVTNSMVVANRAFSNRARELAKRCNCALVDRDVLKDWLGGQFTSSGDLFRFVSEHRITRYRISNDDLVRAYRSLRGKLARSVRICDMDAQGEYSSSVYRRRWGCWRNFLIEVGDAPMQPTKDDLVAEYRQVRTQVGATPTRSQFDRLSAYSHSTYERIWGSWRCFLESVGDKPTKKHMIPMDEFVKEFRRVRAILGKPPTQKEMEQFGTIAPNTFRRLWGSWSDFLKEMGELYQRRNIPDQDLIKAYLKLRKQLKKQSLTQRDMNKYGEYSSSVYERRWGSWTAFLSTVGDIGTRRTNITDEDLKSDYMAVSTRLGKPKCSGADIRKHGQYALSTYLKRFGSLRQLQQIMDDGNSLRNGHAVTAHYGPEVKKVGVKKVSGTNYE
jgi:predicted RecB family endonuclease